MSRRAAPRRLWRGRWCILPLSRLSEGNRLMPSVHRFPPPWSAEETDACFIVRDHNGQALAYVLHNCRMDGFSGPSDRSTTLTFSKFTAKEKTLSKVSG